MYLWYRVQQLICKSSLQLQPCWITLDYSVSWRPSWSISISLYWSTRRLHTSCATTQTLVSIFTWIGLAWSLLLLFILFAQNALSLGVLSLIGHQILSHLLFSIKSKACWLMKSLVLDSKILRERHKISVGKSLLVLLLCFPCQ